MLLPSGHVFRAESGATAETYDPAAGTLGAWTRAVAPGSTGFASQALLLAGPPNQCGTNCGKVLVRFGTEQADWKLYDPAGGPVPWSAAGLPLYSRGFGATFTLLSGPNCEPNCGKVLAVGGFADFGPLGGGENSKSPRAAELYDPKTNSWGRAASLGVGRVYHAAVQLRGPRCGANCGKVLVVGGGWRCDQEQHIRGLCATAEVTADFYDPRSGAWAAAPRPTFSHYSGHSATTLADSRILVAGRGGGNAGEAEVFDPAANDGAGGWSPAVGSCACVTTRSEEPALASALLPDGKVLVIAGGSVIAELYDPTLNRFSQLESATQSVFSLTLLTGSGCGMNCGKLLALGPTGAQLYIPPGYAAHEASGDKAPASSFASGSPLGSGLLLGALVAVAAGAVGAAVLVWANRRRQARRST